MKSIKIFIISVFALTFLGFTQKITKKVNVETSVVIWTGYKLTGQHEGTITLKEGVLLFENETLTGGNFIIDMTTINTTDLQGGAKNRLDGHLKNEHFFDVDKHKTAAMTFKDVKPNGSSYFIIADLTIKGITKEISFNMKVSENLATANLKIDRTKFNITYKSASLSNVLKDKAIYDEFDLRVKLEF
jgi:polyisoprenoid-binding protein YceI